MIVQAIYTAKNTLVTREKCDACIYTINHQLLQKQQQVT